MEYFKRLSSYFFPNVSSKKRTSAESNNEEQTNESSDSLLQEGNDAKRAKLDSLTDTTLQDLPMELLEYILIKVVVMEVKSMKFAKCVWKEKADLAIHRIRSVNSFWNSVLTTKFFRKELHRTLDKTVQDTIRLEILHQFPIPFYVIRLTTMKDEIFMRCNEENIIVYNRNTMAREKDVVAPQGTRIVDVAGCDVSNCVYALGLSTACRSMLRITKDAEQQFIISPWINDLNDLPISTMSVSASGCLIIASTMHGSKPPAISIYDASGYLQHRIMLCFGFFYWNNMVQRSNGNLVLITLNDQLEPELAEIDTTGRIERRIKSSIQSGVHSADNMSGRTAIVAKDNKIKLLDSELNLLDVTGPNDVDWNQLHYDYKRNEAVGSFCVDQSNSLLTILRFIEE